MESRGKTLFIDIDGTIFKHQGDATGACFYPFFAKDHLLPAVRYYFNEWSSKGYRLILTTGRNESMRGITEAQLREVGLFWDCLLMGIGGGERILINDISPRNNEPKAIALNLVRDSGFENIDAIYHEAKIKAGAKSIIDMKCVI